MLFLVCQPAFSTRETLSNESNDPNSVKSKIPVARETSANELEKLFPGLSRNNQ